MQSESSGRPFSPTDKADSFACPTAQAAPVPEFCWTQRIPSAFEGLIQCDAVNATPQNRNKHRLPLANGTSFIDIGRSTAGWRRRLWSTQ